MITKNVWINRILSCVKDIASREYQERAWIKSEIHMPCSLEDLACSFFEDCFIREFIREKMDKFQLSKKQKSSLIDFVTAFDEYTDRADIYFPRLPPKIDESKVLADPEWQKIQKMAQKVLDAFEKMKYEPENRDYWLQSLLGSISKYADIEDQKKMWVEKSEFFFSTPRDMYDGLFMYGEFDSFIEKYVEKMGLSKSQTEILQKFYAQILATPFKTAELEGILDHPDWQNIQALARKTMENFSDFLQKQKNS